MLTVSSSMGNPEGKAGEGEEGQRTGGPPGLPGDQAEEGGPETRGRPASNHQGVEATVDDDGLCCRYRSLNEYSTVRPHSTFGY